MIALFGAATIGWAVVVAVTAPFALAQGSLFLLLTLTAVICARRPISLGLGASFVTLDSIPFVLAALVLQPELAIIMVVCSVSIALIGQPALPGWTGRMWLLYTPLAAAIPMLVASGMSDVIAAPSGSLVPIYVLEALVVSIVLELLFDALVVIELEADEPGAGIQFVRGAALPLVAANVLLPTIAVAVLTPYLAQTLWQFALLLPVLLLAMYGALWVANSQQLQKRRGDRLKDTFSRYVPEGIVDDNLESMQEIELGGEQHEISVLFCDIRGFTTWSEDKGATEVITELNVLLSELSASVMETGGTLDKFTGDGLMAFWGAPVPVEDHADRACRAALDMLVRLDSVNQRRREEGHEPFAIGVAVHSGPAVVGNVGHERRLDYTAIGDTVNTTARLESSTKDLGAVLLVSRSTVDLLGEEVRDRAMRVGDVLMKGKARPVEAWALRPLRPELEHVDDEFAA